MSLALLPPPTPVFPYRDMPYALAPAWSFGVAEWSVLLMLLCCGLHALRKGWPGALSYLFGGFLFGLLLEYVEVMSQSYSYGHFNWMLGRSPVTIPIWIGGGWAIILYTSRLFSDALGLPLTAAAAFDTLLALNIDLSMDVIAYRLHMWHWDWAGTGLDPLKAQWFGVPFGNFVGWATVVFCYSVFSRLWERALAPKASVADRTKPYREVSRPTHGALFLAVAALSLLCSQLVLWTLETWGWKTLATYLGLTSGRRLLLIVFVMAALVVDGWRRRTGALGRVPALALGVPC